MDKAPRKLGRPPANHRLIVWGEKREEPDWDKFVAALLDHAMREVMESDPDKP